MSTYLRDRFLRNVSLNSDRLRSINQALLDIAQHANNGLEENDPKRVTLFYLIRFDSKGFLLTDFEALLEHHKNSKITERINFHLDSALSRRSNKQTGKSVDLRLDVLNKDNCTMTIQDDDASWTEATFCRIDEELERYTNRNYLIKNAWTPFIVQIVGVLAGFFLSLWAALRISPNLSIQYSFVVTFVLAFLIYSNIWAYLNQQILKFIDFLFPNVALKDSRGIHWLGQAFIGAVFVAAAFYLLDILFGFVGELLKEILK